jgi:hypothetical protein
VCRLGAWEHGPTLRNGCVLTGAMGAAIGCYGGLAVAFRLQGVDGVMGKLRRRLSR